MKNQLTLTKFETVTVSETDSLARLIYLDDEGFRPPFRPVLEVCECAKADLPNHECHGSVDACPVCELEFCDEEFSDPAGTDPMHDFCTDCWAIYKPILDCEDYYYRHPHLTKSVTAYNYVVTP